MIACSKPGCLASYSWVGHTADKALANLAKDSGWKVIESSGWICPKHAPQPGSAGVGEGTP